LVKIAIFITPPAFNAPIKGNPSEVYIISYGKIRMVGLPRLKSYVYYLFVIAPKHQFGLAFH